MIRVLIADDHAIVLEGLASLIEAQEDMTVVGKARDGHEALKEAMTIDLDCLLLDLSMPMLSGIEVLRRVKGERPELPVVVLSMYPEDHLALHLYAIGANAYLSKERDPNLVLEAIRVAARGETFHTEDMIELQRNSPIDTDMLPHTTLTAREHQVFILLLEGHTSSTIAATLDLSVSTISNHLKHIRAKLGVESVADIVKYAHRVGLVQP